MLRRVVIAVVDFASRRPLVVLFATIFAILGLAFYAKDIELRSQLLELLPRDSPGFQAFEHQAGRVGGGSNLIVMVTSPDPKKNELFIDDLSRELSNYIEKRKACVAQCAPQDEACKGTCGRDLIAYVESGTKDVRAFYEDNKWLYADIKDLEEADNTLDKQIAIRSGLVEDLSLEAEGTDAGAAAPSAAAAGPADAAPPALAVTDGAPAKTEKKHALGMDDFINRWDDQAKKKDSFPTGYFANPARTEGDKVIPEGAEIGLRILSNTSLGDVHGDSLLGEVARMVERLGFRAEPDRMVATSPRYHPDMKVGFTGDIASAAGEKKALMSEAAWATGGALVVILFVLVLYYRSIWALMIIALPTFFGVAAAYAFARGVIGYINTSGAFLGAIILGNGINYPIVLLSRYQEFRARGMEAAEARREAVLNAFRAELVGASVAAIAYGSLTFTRFRGFNQFGLIGFVGMLLVWLAIVPLVPAMVVLVEAAQERVRAWLGRLDNMPARALATVLAAPPPRLREDGSRSLVTKFFALSTSHFPWAFIAMGVLLTGYYAVKIPKYLSDPWEYDFGRLGSKHSDVGGAGMWSDVANRAFGGRTNIAGALMIADAPEQVPLVKAQMFENDKRDPEGLMLSEITTVQDMLPGTAEEQAKKLEVLDSIRSRLTPRVMGEMDEDERKQINRMRPPERLHTLGVNDLPPMVKRRFMESNGTLGTVFYVKARDGIVFADGHNHLRLSKTTDNVRLPDGTVVQTASRSTIFAEMLNSMRHDGPRVTLLSFGAVVLVVLLAARNVRTALGVIASLLMGVVCLTGWAARSGTLINYVNFIAFPITFGIGCEYPFNIADRTRLLGGNVKEAVMRSGGAVMLCSFTTVVGYGSMIFSDFQALESFGKLAVVGELTCVFAAVFVLPSILAVVTRGQHKTP